MSEASKHDDWRIKIKTTDGKKQTFRWIEERDGNVVSIQNAERVFIDKDKVNQIVKFDPNPQVIPLDSATKHNGTVSIQIKDDRGKYESHEFIKFEKQGDSYKCYKMTGEDTLTVVIPLEQVEKVKVVNMGATGVVNVIGWSAIIYGLTLWYYSTHGIY